MSLRTYDSYRDEERFLDDADGAEATGIGYILDDLEYSDTIMLVRTRGTYPDAKYMLQIVENDGNNIHVYLSDETLDELLHIVAAVRMDTQDGAS